MKISVIIITILTMMNIILMFPSAIIYVEYSKSPTLEGYFKYMIRVYDPDYYIANYFYNSNITRWCI